MSGVVLGSVAASVLLWGQQRASLDIPQEPRRSTQIKYINPEVPEVRLPAYEGKRYQASLPDTLDLAERARLAVNGLTGPTNPEADYELYFSLVLGNNPPFMYPLLSKLAEIRSSIP